MAEPAGTHRLWLPFREKRGQLYSTIWCIYLVQSSVTGGARPTSSSRTLAVTGLWTPSQALPLKDTPAGRWVFSSWLSIALLFSQGDMRMSKGRLTGSEFALSVGLPLINALEAFTRVCTATYMSQSFAGFFGNEVLSTLLQVQRAALCRMHLGGSHRKSWSYFFYVISIY